MLWNAPIFSFLKNVFEMMTVVMLVVVMVVIVMEMVMMVTVVVVVVKLSSVQPEKRVRHPHLA